LEGKMKGFSGESVHRCKCFGEDDGRDGSWSACPPDLCEADVLLARAEAAEAELAAEKLLRHQDDLALVAAEAEAEVQKRLYEASVKDRVRLREALTDFAEHGTRFDCNPTVMVHNTPEWVASQEWWQNRATQMDVAVRNRARAALREDA
jgi:hypothetical protein